MGTNFGKHKDNNFAIKYLHNEFLYITFARKIKVVILKLWKHFKIQIADLHPQYFWFSGSGMGSNTLLSNKSSGDDTAFLRSPPWEALG